MELFPIWERLTVPEFKGRLNTLPREILRMVRPGPGIRVFPSGDGGICIAADGAGRVMRGGGGGGVVSTSGQFVSLNADGDTMEVYLWTGSAWATSTTTIYKPYILRYSYWNGATITYADGSSRSYNATSLSKAYQRQATWTGGNSEIQEITSPYGVGETLNIVGDIAGNLMDDNNAGRHWAEAAS